MWWPTELTPWSDLPPYGNKDSKKSAIFYCLNCGNGMDLRNHTIDSEGNVVPSVVEPLNPSPAKCPTLGCSTFHDYLKLEDWSK